LGLYKKINASHTAFGLGGECADGGKKSFISIGHLNDRSKVSTSQGGVMTAIKGATWHV